MTYPAAAISNDGNKLNVETKIKAKHVPMIEGPAKAETDTYNATSKNLVHSAKQNNLVTEYLVNAHDAYYDAVMRLCTPFAAAMPRDINVFGTKVTVFTANIVTYARGFLIIPIVLGMKYNYLGTASFLVMFHDFLDHLDGVIAKQQARDGRSKGDDGKFGAFIDAQMDKVVFCLCLWSFLVLTNSSGPALTYSIVVLTSAALFAIEVCIAVVRTADYFEAKYSTKGRPALRAVSEGKLKQKFESVGIAFYCLSLPDPATRTLSMVLGTVCLWFAVYFSTQSLAHKLRARKAIPITQ